MKKSKHKLIVDEDDEIIKVGWSCYKNYFTTYFGGLKFVLVTIICQGLYVFASIANQYVVGHWSQSQRQVEEFEFYCLLAFGFTLLIGLSIFLRAYFLQMFSWSGSKKLHEQMIHHVLRAPVNLYFDTTPIGRILNKFSSDLNDIEVEIQYQIGMVFTFSSYVLQSIVVAMIVIPWLGLLVPLIVLISYFIVSRVSSAIRETVRLQSTIKSPMLSFFQESINGQSTIRAFKKTDQFIAGFNKLLDQNILAQQMSNAVQGWFALRVDLFAFFLMLILILTCIAFRDVADPILLSIVVTQVLTIQESLIWALKIFVQIETKMVKVERCMKLLEIPQEKLASAPGIDEVLAQRTQWPEHGQIQFNNVSLKYRPDTELVLKNLSFEVEKGQKIGVVGRTGAGKSTICLAISRIVELFEGQIFVDGLDISGISIETLRNRITLIPQDPTMFTGTLRFNLDPEGKASDDEIIELIKDAQLQSLLDGNPKGLEQEITENGSNLSSGERQLLCICRAILRKSKLVILDEATANIDVVTEQQIQNLINNKFRDATMLVIAHRINTIIQSDKVLVLSHGQVIEYDCPAKLMSNAESEFSQLISELKKKER